MSNKANHSLTSEKIQKLLAAVGKRSEEDTSKNTNTVEYNWRQSHYFSRDQLKKLNDFTGKVAQNCAGKFTQLYHSEFTVTVTSATQHFANELTASDNNQGNYYLAFGDKEQIFGLVGVPGQTAIFWATQLLGDSKSAENSDRSLSQLEQSLLFDISSGVIEAISNSYGDYDLRPAGEIVKGQMPMELNGAEEFFKITVSVKKSGSENSSEAYFLLLCDTLQTIAGQKTQTSKELSSQDTAKAMLNHLRDIPVPVTVQLAYAMFNFQEIMSLQIDDILVLDKKVNEPAELIVEGKAILRGRLAKSEGKHALVVTEMCSTK